MSDPDFMRIVTDLRVRLDALEVASGLYTTEADLDGPKGDPSVKFTPRRYTGQDVKGRRFSQCPPDALDAIAEALAWSADHPKEGREKYADYDRQDARRARTWARRLRSGWAPPKSGAPEFPGDATGSADAPGFAAPSFDAPPTEDDIPF